MPFKSFSIIATAFLLLLAGGCTTTTVSDRPPRSVRTANTGDVTPPVAGVGVPSNAVDMKDPCAARMHDLIGLLYKYYVLNKRLPATLDELKPLADVGQSTDFSCPGSNRQFVYIPQSPQALAADRVVAYAPDPRTDGKFRAIVMGIPRGNQAIAAAVVNLSEPELQGQLALTPGPGNPTSAPIR